MRLWIGKENQHTLGKHLPSSSSLPQNIRRTCVLHLKPDFLLNYLHGILQNPVSGMKNFVCAVAQDVLTTDSFAAGLKYVPFPF